jgi:hypothetical protein
MPYQYTIPQRPDLLIVGSSSDPDKARYKATQELVRLINEEQLDVQIPEGFSTRQLIEVTEEDLMAEDEDKIIEAVKVLSKLSASKRKVQELHEQAIQAKEQVDILFKNSKTSREEFQEIEEGLNILKEFARANLRYKEALLDAENARLLLDKALEPPKLHKIK